MKSIRLVALAACLMLTTPLLAAQEKPRGIGETVEGVPFSAPSSPDSPAEAGEPVPEVRPLTRLDKIAQLMLVTLGGMYRPDNDDRLLFRDYAPGGVVIPAVARPSHAAEYIKGLRALPVEQQNRLPMLIATNVYSLTQHERGPEHAFIQLPSMLSIAAANDPLTTERLAGVISDHLATMGFNMHLGPSLTLATRISGGSGSLNTFGSNPHFTAEAGHIFFRTLSAKGIQPVAMGFPGGGNNRVDDGPAVLVTPRTILNERDLLPYIQAIQDGVPMVHVGNTIVPTLDRSLVPASLSRVVMQDILRRELGFEGLIIAGPVDANELSGIYTPSEAAMKALEAGADLIHVSQTSRRAMRIISDIATAVENEKFDESLIDAAFERVKTFKEEKKLFERELPDVSDAKALELKQGHFDEPYLIERRAITLVQNRDGVLPLSKERSMPASVTGVTGVEELHEGLEQYLKGIGQQPITTAKHIQRVQDFEIDRLTRHVEGLKTAICIFTNEVKPQGQARIVKELQDKGVRVVVVLLGFPDNLDQFAGAEGIVLAYNPTGPTGQTMKAVADVLVGQSPVAILPAVRDLERKVNEVIDFDVRDVIRAPMGRLPVTLDPPFIAGYSVLYDPAPAIDKVVWDFGDGKTSKDHQATHAYTMPGRYPVKLVVTDRQGDVNEGLFNVVVD